MKTLKKLFSVSAIVALLGTLVPMYAFGANYTDELEEAYKYAYAHKVTTQKTIDSADMYGNLTRVAMAKMIANYATTVLGLEADTSRNCTFTDVTAALDAEFDNGVTNACQLGLMGIDDNGNVKATFDPKGVVTRAQFATALSRAISQAEDGEAIANGNPYYRTHIEYLNKKGIVKSEAEYDVNNVEKRGYVMLMMMRADDSYTPDNKCTAEEMLKCVLLTDDEYDACMAACEGEEEPGEDEPAKSGTLKVTVSANNGAKAIIGGTSDLDTINFNASEAGISVEKIVLERYGYSSADGVTVWLEDVNGTKVSNEKTINSKDQTSLTIKSDYREMDKTDAFVIVTSIDAGTTGGTIGFKVIEVASSAETLNLANYTPTTYDMVEYNGATVTYGYKGSSTTYHYTANERYDVARLKVTAGSSAITMNGFTLTDAGNLNMNRYVDSSSVKVTVDGNDVPATVSIDKNDKVEISLKNGYAIEAKKNAIFVVSLAFDELDTFNTAIQLTAATTDLRGTENKTNTRVTFTGDGSTAPTYTFNGGQIKMTSEKLGNVDAPAGASEVVFAKGTIEVNGQIINMPNFTLNTSRTGVDSIEILLNGAVVGDATPNKTTGTIFEFKGVTFDQDGTLKFRLNMDTEATSGDITFITPFNNTIFSGAKYDESNQPVDINDVIGSISYSTVKVQSAKGSLANKISKSVEYLTSKTSKQVIFDGTYTAKKGDLNLNEFAVEETNALKTGDSVTFYLSINGSNVSTISLSAGNTGDSKTFSNVPVKKGEEVSVKLEAEVYAANTGEYTYALTLKGEDSDGTPAGEATENAVKMSFVNQGGVIVSVEDADAANTVLLRASNIKLAKFTVKPSKAEGTTLDSFEFTLTVPNTGKVAVKVDGTEIDTDNLAVSGTKYTVSDLAESLDNDGIAVEISYKDELVANDYELVVTKVNETSVSKTFNKKVVNALVTVTNQENLGDTTKFTLGVEKYDEQIEVTGLTLSGTSHAQTLATVSNGDTMEFENGTTADFITNINYTASGTVAIDKTTYKDFFKFGSEYLKVFKAKD